MPLFETLALGIGVGIAKGILKVWFQEDPLSLGVGNSLVDFINSKTTSTLQARASAREWKKVSERIAASIEISINERYPNLPPDRKEFVANAAGETVNSTELNAELLVKSNLSPNDLLQVFLAKSGAEGGNPSLSSLENNLAHTEEKELYKIILLEASQLIIDGAAQYPRFTPTVFSELLQGQDEHLRKIELILSEIGRIRTGSGSSVGNYDNYAENYRRAVIRRLDELQLFGVDLSPMSRRYKLSTAYVSLVVERSSTLTALEKVLPANKDNEGLNNRESVNVEEALRQTQRLFIRGDAGSGKTTLLQWTAVTSAARNHQDQLAEWNDYTPFFIKLRDFSEKKLPSPEDFSGLISEITEPPPAGWERQQLKSGKSIVLVDGLDELPTHRKDDVRRWLHDLCEEFPDARYIISSRPTASEEGWLAADGFLEANLQEMTSTDVEAFIVHWHDAVREAMRDTNALSQLNELQSSLLVKIRKNAAIYRLVTTPLLCAVVCALHRDRMQNIPEDRIELYEACIDMFLRRDHERRIELPQFPNLNSRQIRFLLSDLAYWFIRNSISISKAEDIDSRLQNKLNSFTGLSSGITGRSVRQGLVARSGILREPSEEEVDFPHRTFQEFLAAKEIVEQRDFGVLLQNASDQQNWSETIVLATGMASQMEAENLIRELVNQADAKNDISILFLAVGCLQCCVSIDTSIKTLVQERLSGSIPPRNISEARKIAKAGDLVVPYLSKVRSMKVWSAASSVATLAMIGSRAAMNELKRVSQTDSRSGVRSALLTAATRFHDPAAFIRDYIPPISSISIYGTSWQSFVKSNAWGMIDTRLNPELVRVIIGSKWTNSITFRHVADVHKSLIERKDSGYRAANQPGDSASLVGWTYELNS